MPPAKKKAAEQAAGSPAWMTTFGDMMSLLLTFFVLLTSFAYFDEVRFTEMSGSLEAAFGVLPGKRPALELPQRVEPGNRGPRPRAEDQEVESMIEHIERAVSELGLVGQVEVNRGDVAISVRIPSKVLFDSGSANLKPEALDVLNMINQMLLERPVQVFVEGHTDNVPIQTEEFPSNWHLSTARAIGVVSYLASKGFPQERLAAVGYGKFRPVDTNDTAEGRSKNRRVEIRIEPRQRGGQAIPLFERIGPNNGA